MSEPVVAKTLTDLIGPHVMDYTPTTDVRHPFDSDACGIAFVLSGVTYMLFEDGNDGYRSSAGALLGYVGMPYEMGGRWGEYARWNVIGSHRTKGDYGREDDVIEFRLVDTGELVLQIGTENVDDYYPSFVGVWTPPASKAREA